MTIFKAWLYSRDMRLESPTNLLQSSLGWESLPINLPCSFAVAFGMTHMSKFDRDLDIFQVIFLYLMDLRPQPWEPFIWRVHSLNLSSQPRNSLLCWQKGSLLFLYLIFTFATNSPTSTDIPSNNTFISSSISQYQLR